MSIYILFLWSFHRKSSIHCYASCNWSSYQWHQVILTFAPDTSCIMHMDPKNRYTQNSPHDGSSVDCWSSEFKVHICIDVDVVPLVAGLDLAGLLSAYRNKRCDQIISFFFQLLSLSILYSFPRGNHLHLEIVIVEANIIWYGNLSFELGDTQWQGGLSKDYQWGLCSRHTLRDTKYL